MFYVYLLASEPFGTLYVGVTSDLWFEAQDSIEAAIRREKQIKEWKREWKFNLIGRANPHWIDLYHDLVSGT